MTVNRTDDSMTGSGDNRCRTKGPKMILCKDGGIKEGRWIEHEVDYQYTEFRDWSTF